MTPTRSVFFVPGGSERLLAKAPGIRADIVAFDLEDAVPPAGKPRARELVQEHLKAVAPGTRAYCRVNAWETGLTDADLEGVVHDGLAGICLPKCEGPEDVRALDAALERLERSRGRAPGSVEVQLFVESARGLVHAYAAATASSRVRSLVFGSLDYYAWWCVFRWLRKKHQHVSMKALKALYPPAKESGTRAGQWHHQGVTLFVTARTRVGPYRLAWARPPLYAIRHGEPGA